MVGLEAIDGLGQLPRWVSTSMASAMPRNQMAAVLYARICRLLNEIHTVVICSKTKVVPLKCLTIPRLELSAAVCLKNALKIGLPHSTSPQRPMSGIHLWTDSSIVLTWLNHHPSRWKNFIHNRVCFIQEALFHISDKINPADCVDQRCPFANSVPTSFSGKTKIFEHLNFTRFDWRTYLGPCLSVFFPNQSFRITAICKRVSAS